MITKRTFSQLIKVNAVATKVAVQQAPLYE